MDKIGKYKIDNILGKGAMGVVYKALDPDIDREVAIKTIRFDLISDGTDKEELMKRFIREAQAAGRLSHPNIVTIYDVGREEDLTYIVMQYIKGKSLQRMIAAKNEFSYAEICALMSKICEALDYAHKQGIVHRDIKPANVLMDDAGKPFIVDFGVARVETSTITQTGTTIGTPSYMSPEQVMGKTVDNRSDVFSLGVILYEILTGKSPFDADNITTVIYKIINEEPPSLKDVKKGLPPHFENIIRKALAKDPENRYETCGKLAEDLRKIERTTQETIAFDSEIAAGLEEPRREKRSKRGLIIGVGFAVIFAAVASIVYYLTFLSGKKPQSLPSEAKSQIVSEAPETKTPELPPASPPAEVLPSSVENKLGLIEQSYASGNYAETVRLAEEILAVDKNNAVARDYLKLSREKLNTALIAQTLNAGINSYKKGDYGQSMREMQKVLTLDKDNKEAIQYLNMGERALSEREILKIVERQRKAEENKDLLSLLGDIGSSSLSEQRKEDSMLLFNYYDDIKSAISDVSVKFNSRTRASVRFSQILTALYKKTGQNSVIFEGIKTWEVEKRGNTWKIIGIK
jgi:tetratricopeptide (TPR) repeat protein